MAVPSLPTTLTLPLFQRCFDVLPQESYARNLSVAAFLGTGAGRYSIGMVSTGGVSMTNNDVPRRISLSSRRSRWASASADKFRHWIPESQRWSRSGDQLQCMIQSTLLDHCSLTRPSAVQTVVLTTSLLLMVNKLSSRSTASPKPCPWPHASQPHGHGPHRASAPS